MFKFNLFRQPSAVTKITWIQEKYVLYYTSGDMRETLSTNFVRIQILLYKCLWQHWLLILLKSLLLFDTNSTFLNWFFIQKKNYKQVWPTWSLESQPWEFSSYPCPLLVNWIRSSKYRDFKKPAALTCSRHRPANWDSWTEFISNTCVFRTSQNQVSVTATLMNNFFVKSSFGGYLCAVPQLLFLFAI